MNTRSLIATLAVCATALALSVILTNAGPLAPPPGPIAPTNKTLQEIEPRIPVGPDTTPGDADSLFTISQPGSYYLTGDVVGVPGKHGVKITTSNVTLDLNSFTVQGAPGTLDGIFASAFGTTDIVITNGVVADWANDGVDMFNASRSALRRVRVVRNKSEGVIIGGLSVIDSCFVNNNGGVAGIKTDFSCLITNTAAVGNVDGISTGGGCTIVNSVASHNGRNGIVTSSGIFNDNTLVVACMARSNGLAGVITADGSHVSQSVAVDNGGEGFAIGSNSVITGCTATANGGDGILAGSGATIVDNSCSSNNGDGIQANSDSLLRGNMCDGNTSFGASAGIRVVGSDVRVEHNTVTDNNTGISVDFGGNIIIGNSASGNGTDYNIVPGNSVGQILTVTGATITTSNPWANFSF